MLQVISHGFVLDYKVSELNYTKVVISGTGPGNHFSPARDSITCDRNQDPCQIVNREIGGQLDLNRHI